MRILKAITGCMLVLMCGLFLPVVLEAQETVPVERSDNKVIIEGKVYYIHIVKPGQTLYSIARAYNVSEKEITIENPGAISGIQIGQALKIPVSRTLNKEVDTSSALKTPQPGEKYHTVREGETVFAISRMYDVSVQEVIDANPGVDIRDLHPGQQLVIPAVKKKQEEVFNEEGYAYHKVKRKETLYSIARFYDVTVDDIRGANPELGWGGPKTGQILRIPLPQVTTQPDLEEVLARQDTLFQEPPDTTEQEPYMYEDLEYLFERPGRVFKIAYFIPFDFTVPEPLDSLLKDVRSESRKNRIIERYRMEQKIPQSVNFLEYFQGSLMAIDSLRKAGMKLEVHYFDTRKSMSATRQLLEKDGMEDMDLILGPFYPFNLEIVSEFAADHHIPLITPFYNDLNLVEENPYLFQISPSLEAEYERCARLIGSKYSYNIVYAHEGDSLLQEQYEQFKALIYNELDRYAGDYPIVFKEIIIGLDNLDEIVHSLSRDMKNLIVVPTENEAVASSLVSSLYFQLKNFDIEVVGTSVWPEFTSIDYSYFHQLSLIFYSAHYLDMLDPEVEEFMQRYRYEYYHEPLARSRKGVNYGVLGYDMTFYFLGALREYGSRFILKFNEYEPDLVLSTYRFSRVSDYGGYENVNIDFYQFTRDKEITRIEIPPPPLRDYFFRPLDNQRRKYLNLDRDREYDPGGR